MQSLALFLFSRYSSRSLPRSRPPLRRAAGHSGSATTGSPDDGHAGSSCHGSIRHGRQRGSAFQQQVPRRVRAPPTPTASSPSRPSAPAPIGFAPKEMDSSRWKRSSRSRPGRRCAPRCHCRRHRHRRRTSASAPAAAPPPRRQRRRRPRQGSKGEPRCALTGRSRRPFLERARRCQGRPGRVQRIDQRPVDRVA